MKLQLTDYKRLLTYIIIATLPIMAMIDISDNVKINFSVADIFVAFWVFVFLFDFKKLSFKENFPYWWYFTGLLSLLIISNTAAYFSQNINNGSFLMQLNEAVKFITIALYFYIGYFSVGNIRDLSRTSFVWACTALVVCLIGIITTIAAFNPGFLGNLILFDNTTKRLMGTLTDPNLAAAYLSVSFFVALLLIHFSEEKWQSRIGYISVIFIFLSIVLTQSRSGIIAFFLALSVYFVFTSKRSLKLVPVFLILIFVGFFGFLSIDSGVFDNQLTVSIENRFRQAIDQTGQAEIRVNLARAAFEMGKDFPIFGVGRGNFRLNSKPYYEMIGIDTESRAYEITYDMKIPHNTYLTFFAELGIVGLLLFLYIFYRAIKVNWLFRKVNLIFLALLFSYLIQANGINLENFRGIWFILGLIFATIKLDFEKDLVNKENQLNISNKKLSFMLIFLFIIGLVFYVYASGHYTRPIKLEGQKAIEYVGDVIPGEQYVFEYYIEVKGAIGYEQSSILNIYSIIDKEEILLNQVVYWSPKGTGSLFFIPLSDQIKIEFVPLIAEANIILDKAKIANIYEGLGRKVFTEYIFIPSFLKDIFLQMGLINKWSKEDIIYSFGLKEPVNLSDKILVLGVDKEEISGGKIKLTFEFECIGDMEIDYRIWLHANVIDKYILPENRLEHGFANWGHSLSTRTSQWQIGEKYIHEYLINANPGQYHNVKFGFWQPEWPDAKTHRLEPSVNIGYIQIRGDG